MIKDQKLQKYETMVDVGKQFYLQAEVSTADKLMVKISNTYFVEMTPSEALDFGSKKVVYLTSALE